MAFPVNGVNPGTQAANVTESKKGQFQEALSGAKGDRQKGDGQKGVGIESGGRGVTETRIAVGTGRNSASADIEHVSVVRQGGVVRIGNNSDEDEIMEANLVHNILADGSLDDILASDMGEEFENSPLGEYLSDLLEKRIREYNS